MDSNVSQIFPLTEMQKGMLFHSVMEPNSGIYCEQFMFQIDGSLDVDRFERAWQGVVNENDILRISTCFKGVREPVQVVHKEVSHSVSLVDLSDNPDAFLSRLDQLLISDRHRGFRFDQPELIRAALVKRTNDQHILLLTYHHLILDAWSLFLLMKELVEHYDTGGSIAKVSPFYSDYVKSLRSSERVQSDDFWKSYLTGYGSVTHVADAQSNSAVSRNSLETHLEIVHHVSATLSARLLDCSRRTGLTLNTLIQGAWGLTVAGASGDDDVVFGITITHRPHHIASIDKMVGIFINSLPKRIRISRDQTIADYLTAIQSDQANIKRHEQVALPDIQILSDIPGGQPIFQTLLIFENFLKSPAWQQSRDLSIRHFRYVGWTNYPMAIEAMPPADDKPLFFQVKFDTNYFSAKRVQELLINMEGFLEVIAARPDDKVSDLVSVSARAVASTAVRRPTEQSEDIGSAYHSEIADIWKRIIGLEQFDSRLSFFEAGGHSLLLFQLQAELRTQYGVDIELVDLFDSPTVALQAQRVEALLAS